jgi:Ca2+-binding RTX toxin-like protein
MALASCSSVLFAGSAHAVTIIGNDSSAPDTLCVTATFLQTGVASGTYAVPAPGVITSWYYHDASPIAPGLKLKVARFEGIAALLVGDSTAPTVRSTNSINGPFLTRIPVQANDFIGIYTSAGGTVPCSVTTTSTSDSFFDVTSDVPPGTLLTSSSGSGNKTKFPVQAWVEADADGDGYGDDTQDFCSTDPTTQGPCRSPGSVAFAPQMLGTQSPAQTVTISSTAGISPLSISSISSGGDFMVTSNSCGASIAPTHPCSVGIAFAPAAAGPRTGALSITDAANGSPHTIALSGTGAASPTTPPAATAETCNGKPATITGTQGPDQLSGTPAADVIAALGGNDKVSGLAGNDTICGGSGKDTLNGGKGNDKLYGEAGKDTLKGGPGKDKLNGGPGRDKQIQ